MEILQLIIAVLAGLLSLILTFGMLYCLTSTEPSHTHMSYDEEIDWLMKEHRLTKEEAVEIANLPWPKIV